jgi:Protein of unknown function (DUF1549)/Protein of unknown function (DUF1553)/Planctomycete cytochrome C
LRFGGRAMIKITLMEHLANRLRLAMPSHPSFFKQHLAIPGLPLLPQISRILTLVGLLFLADNLQAVEHFFNRDIRPILSENCFYCHGQDSQKREADLRLDDRDSALAAGAFVPGDLDASDAIRRMLSDDPDEKMPPPKSNRVVSAKQIETLKQWVLDGAKYAPHWAFVAPIRPKEPKVMKQDWVKNPIDQFVLAKLESSNLSPSPEADPATLIKRLSIDLIGLPPTLQEVSEFVNDSDPQAYEKLVDRLLNSKHYGERMALAWLDAARYADSNGFQQDGDTWQWQWRDWLVKALNDDLPFDQFTIQQLAGDLLPEATVDQKIASSFNRNHLLNGEGGAIAEEQRFVNLFDRMDTTATTWLGLTMACAQCHDHKYDPITQRDYYSLMDAFNRVPETGRPNRISSRIRVAEPYLELPLEKEDAEDLAKRKKEAKDLEAKAKPYLEGAYEGWYVATIKAGKLPEERNGLTNEVVVLLQKPEGERSADDKKKIDAGLRAFFNREIRPKIAERVPALQKSDNYAKELTEYSAEIVPRVMIMSDAQARKTAILNRGDYLSPTEPVSFGTPSFLPPMEEKLPKNRLGFAQWLMSPDHPLTARVQVNRMWQHFFGLGLVKTAEDLGVQSEYPLHGLLLDWLATEFPAQDWSVKKIHRLIVTSATYRQSSRVTEEHKKRDPENRLFSRASRFRMPSMLLRDWALATSELLEPRIGGKPVYPYQPEGVWESLAITKERDFTYPQSKGSELYRRSIYTFWRRTLGPSNMFDTSNRQTCRVRASATSTPLHALTTLNDVTWVEAARVLAERTIKQHKSLNDRITNMFGRVVVRQPQKSELETLKQIFEKQVEFFQSEPEDATKFVSIGEAPRDTSLDPVEHAGFTAVCLAILNLDESLTRE